MPGTSVKPRKRRTTTGPRATDFVKDAQNLDLGATLRLAHQFDLLCDSRPDHRFGVTCSNCGETILDLDHKCPNCGYHPACL